MRGAQRQREKCEAVRESKEMSTLSMSRLLGHSGGHIEKGLAWRHRDSCRRALVSGACQGTSRGHNGYTIR